MTTGLNQTCGTACPPRAKKFFAGKLEKGHERGGEDQISSSVGPCKRWSPWERLWDHNTRHKTAGAPASCLKRTCLSTERTEAANWRRGNRRPGGGGGWSFSYTQVEWGALSSWTYRIEQERWSRSWYAGGLKREGGLVGHYMKPKYNTSLLFSHSWRFMSLLCLPLAPYGFS